MIVADAQGDWNALVQKRSSLADATESVQGPPTHMVRGWIIRSDGDNIAKRLSRRHIVAEADEFHRAHIAQLGVIGFVGEHRIDLRQTQGFHQAASACLRALRASMNDLMQRATNMPHKT